MNRIRIDASVSYDVLIGKGLLKDTGELISSLGNAEHVVIVSDDNVYPLYGDTVKDCLEKAGIRTGSFVFPHGERSKSMAVYEELLEYLCDSFVTRNDLLIALGGGVTGDLAGFAAATYQRGIRFVQIPTSLLAAVDSSVGGKTAVNLKAGKNQAGCFYQPSLVICDTDTLLTLPEEEYRNGIAEVIKYAMIGDRQFLEKLAEHPVKEWQEETIAKCVSMKKDIVMEDEFDTGRRMLLNFGHTLGHSAEKLSGYQIPHGYAVAMGMGNITKAAERHGICPAGTADELIRVLGRYGLPTEIPYPADEVFEAARADKKSTGDKVRIIVPEETGRCVILTIPAEELRDWI